MKKIILSSLAIASLIATGSVFAQTAGSSPTVSTNTMINTANVKTEAQLNLEKRPATKADLKIRIEAEQNARDVRKENQEKIKDVQKEAREIENATSTKTIAEAKKRIEEGRGKAGIERAKHVIKRLNRQIANMEKLAVRISERLVVLKAKGVNTTTSEARLAEASVSIATTKTQVDAINTIIQTTIATATSTTNMNNVMKSLAPQIREAEKSIRNVNKALRDAMKVRAPKHTTIATSTTSTPTTTQ